MSTESLRLQIDDLREQRQAWVEWEEWRRDEEQYRREEWLGYKPSKVQRGVIVTDISND